MSYEDIYKLKSLSIVNNANEEIFKLSEKLKINPNNSINYDTILRSSLIANLTTEDYQNYKTILNADILQSGNMVNIIKNRITISPSEINLDTRTTNTTDFEFNVASEFPLEQAFNLLSDNDLMNINNVIGTARAYLSNIKLNFISYENGIYNYKVTVTIMIEAGFDYTKGGRPSKSPKLYIGLTLKQIYLMTRKEINVNLIKE